MQEIKHRELNPEKVFFTSDTHFRHAAIVGFCNRPFDSVDDMDEALIENWNKVVSNDDTVYHLGDFAFCGTQMIKRIRERLNGKIHLIIGNHDIRNINPNTVGNCFESIEYQRIIEIDGYNVVLNHYPFLCFPGAFNSHLVQLFGHVHTRQGNTGNDRDRLQYLYPTQYDVGVDNNNFTPISWEYVKEKIENQLLIFNIGNNVSGL